MFKRRSGLSLAILLALGLNSSAFASRLVLDAGEDADVGSRSVEVPESVAAGMIDTSWMVTLSHFWSFLLNILPLISTISLTSSWV